MLTSESYELHGDYICEAEQYERKYRKWLKQRYLQMRGSSKTALYSFLRREEIGKALGSTRHSSVYCLHIRGEAGSQYVFMQFMECTNFNEGADEMLTCLCLRWSTDNIMDHIRAGIDGGRTWKRKKIEEWLGVVAFVNIRGCVSVVTLDYGISPSTSALFLRQHRLYINRF